MASRYQSGFTLIELLLAMAIFSLIGIISYQILNVVSQGSERNANYMTDLAAVDSLFFRLQKDLLQAVNRPVKDNKGEMVSAFSAADSETQANLAFTHHGGIVSSRSGILTLQRSRYRFRVQDGILWLDQWAVLDRVHNTRLTSVTMLENIEKLEYELVGSDGKIILKHENAVSSHKPGNMPTGLILRLQHRRLGELQRYFMVAG